MTDIVSFDEFISSLTVHRLKDLTGKDMTITVECEGLKYSINVKFSEDGYIDFEGNGDEGFNFFDIVLSESLIHAFINHEINDKIKELHDRVLLAGGDIDGGAED